MLDDDGKQSQEQLKVNFNEEIYFTPPCHPYDVSDHFLARTHIAWK